MKIHTRKKTTGLLAEGIFYQKDFNRSREEANTQLQIINRWLPSDWLKQALFRSESEFNSFRMAASATRHDVY